MHTRMNPKCGLDEALDKTGFGKYNCCMLASCCLLILAMYVDIFGFSMVMPAAACDMELTTTEQGLLSAVPLIGVMISSYAWGLCADTLGRRFTLLLAMPVGVGLNIAASFAPTFVSLAVLKFLSAACTSSANAAGFVLIGESVPKRQRTLCMYVMASTTLLVQCFIGVFALPILRLSFRVSMKFLFLEYRSWRLLLLVISLPGVLGILALLFLNESPKYLLSKSRDAEALNVLESIYKRNTGLGKDTFPIATVYLDESLKSENADTPIYIKMWQQTAPLFQLPLLKNSLIIYYLLLCAYMTSTGFTIWIPTITNVYFNGENKSGLTFCQVASKVATVSTNSTVTDCDNIVKPFTLYAVMLQSGVAGMLMLLLSSFVNYVGKKRLTITIFIAAALCGLALLFVTIPTLSVLLLYMFLYVALILGNMNTYLVELNPVHLRGMATCLSVVVARGFGFFSVQLIASHLGENCTPLIAGYLLLVASGAVVSILLPPDVQTKGKKEDLSSNANHSLPTEQ